MNSPSLIDRVWWRQHPWLDYGAKLVRYYSLRRYRLRYNSDIPVAGVSHELKTVWLNPRWPTVPDAPIRCHTPGRNFHLAMLKGLIAHEAGHIRFSGPKPQGLLGDLWNMLEDERIERLMAKDHPELVAPFTLLGDLFAASAQPDFKGDALEGCLYWRWCWDQPTPMWRSTNSRWAKVKPLVEQAWEARSSEEVVAIAKAILALLKLPEGTPPDPRFENLSADGGGEPQQGDQGAADSAPPAQGGEPPAPPADQQDDGQEAEQADQEAADGSAGQGDADGNAGQRAADGDADGGATNGNEEAGNGAEPTPPSDQIDDTEQQAAGILLDIDGYARDLAEALKPLSASRLARPHRTRGRFAYDRFKAGSERCYRLKPVEHNRPLEVRVCLDLSYSMGEPSDPTSNMYFAVRTCALLVQACALAGVPIAVYGFNARTTVLGEKVMPSDELLLRLASVASGGTTRLGPTLKLALEGTDRHRVVVVICDGKLGDSDAEVCSDLVKRTDANVLPLLIGSAASGEGFPGFERHLAVAELSELPAMIRAWFLARGQ